MEPLVSAEWLSEHLDDPEVIILEVSSEDESRARYFREGHLPGARFAWWKTLCWDGTDREFPTPDEMTRRLQTLGVSDESRLILVGDPVQFATYAYWVLALCGLDHVASLLDGGRAYWIECGLPLTRAAPRALTATPGRLSPRAVATPFRVGRDNVRAGLRDPGRLLIDMRSDEEYRGERVSPAHFAVDHGAERTGRIPGARHLYFERLLGPDSRF